MAVYVGVDLRCEIGINIDFGVISIKCLIYKELRIFWGDLGDFWMVWKVGFCLKNKGLSEVGIEVKNGIGNRKIQVFMWKQQIYPFGRTNVWFLM